MLTKSSIVAVFVACATLATAPCFAQSQLFFSGKHPDKDCQFQITQIAVFVWAKDHCHDFLDAQERDMLKAINFDSAYSDMSCEDLSSDKKTAMTQNAMNSINIYSHSAGLSHICGEVKEMINN